MPTLLTQPALEVVLQGLHESEIRCGIKNEPPAGGITAWIDYGSRTEKATFYGTIVGDRQVWPAADRMAAWLHETAEARPRLARSRRRRFASCGNSTRQPAAGRGDGSRSTTWAQAKAMQPVSPTRLKGIGSSFPAACTR